MLLNFSTPLAPSSATVPISQPANRERASSAGLKAKTTVLLYFAEIEQGQAIIGEKVTLQHTPSWCRVDTRSMTDACEARAREWTVP
ncbi:hypothetical protein N657DRAFT_644788 [Parathielavia appendiculata]|uniref:Uncharacterized protein n=1 Tax=Parathielavia appendiculata TaxID=2587402 RepID=A0AAN6Z3T0_9PEZI|nr:hypothetical protein N657DRAFT_644788 [Parathielavia appendiculata]